MPVSNIAEAHLRSKLKCFSNQKNATEENIDFRTERMCLLMSACFTFISIPNNLQNHLVSIFLLVYRDNIDEKSQTSLLSISWTMPLNGCRQITSA